MNSAEVLIKFKADTGDAENKIEGLTKSFTLGGLATKGISTAVRVFNQNLGSAVSRVDTLNNFVNVMDNLGVSADESEEAINTLSQKLDGLPTTINEGALAVQRFTAANGNVKKSTDIYLALNNALLAGGASTEVQSNAMEQLNQAYAKGKPDAMEWRAMLTAMPGQLKQVASELGYTSTAIGGDLQKALVDGNLSMDTFMDAFVKLNKDGTGNFKSFEEQARKSTAGINTGMKNMKTAIVRGMANAIQSVNKALKKYGGLAGVFKSIGKVAESVFTTIGKVLSKILPLLTKVASFLIKHKSLILAIITPIVTMTTSTKLLNSGLEKLASLGGGLTGVLKNVWSTMTANPITGVVGLIGGLTTAIVLWNNSIGDAKEKHKKAMEELEKDSEAIKNETTSWKNLKDQRDETLSTGKAEIDKLQNLRDELDNITDANGRVKTGYEERAKFITGELSEALDIEIGYKDGVVQSYEKIREEIDKTIEKKKAEIILNASEEMYTEALKKQYKAEAKLTKYKEKKETAEKKYEVMKKIGIGNMKKYAKEELDQATENYNKQVDLVDGYYFEIEKYDQNYEAFKQGHYDKMNTLDYENAKTSNKNKTDAKRNQMEAEIQQEQNHYDNLLKYAKKYGDDSVKTQLDESKRKLDALKQGLEDYDKQTQTGLNTTSGKWSGFLSGIVSKITGKKPETETAGKDLLDGLKKGVTDDTKQNGIFSAITTLATTMLNKMKKAFGIKSPSREMAEIGRYLLEGMNVGIDDEKDSVIKNVQDLSKDILDTASLMSDISGNINSNLNVNSALVGNVSMPKQAIINNISIKQDPLGRLVQDIKTFSGGAKNDYNYGKGV